MVIMILSYDFFAHSDAEHMTCGTDTDSCMTCSIKYGFLCSYKASPLTPIHSHELDETRYTARFIQQKVM